MKRLIALGVLAVIPALAFAEGTAKPDERAQPGVNWQGQVVRATGQGAPDMKAQNPAQARIGAERAALLDAFRNLLSQVKGVSVDGTRKMGDLMEKDEVRARVEGLIRAYKITNKRYFSDSGVEVEIEVPLATLADVIDPDTTQVLAVGAPKVEPTVTGLVIDARGLKALPALMPRVLDDAGKPLYSIDSLSAAARKSSGVASYVQTVEEAQKSMKAGDKPLVIKATKAAGADIQLDLESAKKLAALNTGFLADGKVVIVLN